MERFRRTLNVLFGNRSSSSLEQKSPAENNSDRPPRHSFAGGRSEFGSPAAGAPSELRPLWYGVGDKPGFGVSFGLSRRHMISDDFYDDIFKKSDELEPNIVTSFHAQFRRYGDVTGRIKKEIPILKQQFIKIFNQDGSQKTKMNGDSMPDVDNTVFIADVKMIPDEVIPKVLDHNERGDCAKMMLDASRTIEFDSKVAQDNVKVMSNASLMAEERINKHKFAQNRTIRTLADVRFDHMDASPSSESAPYNVKVKNMDEPSLENFQVQEVSSTDEKVSKTEEDFDAISATDSKIRLWSNGRTGNIRSLLSTLQYVLWAESGWKVVALVDIIEENELKKAYNRAMLCLHPDKLQQKGVASHKKYLADKVFDILQEAWDQYNSLGTLIC